MKKRESKRERGREGEIIWKEMSEHGERERERQTETETETHREKQRKKQERYRLT